MLSRHGIKQPPHSTFKYRPRDDTSSKNPLKNEICSFCRSQVFTTELYQKLISAQNEERKSVNLKYSRLTEDFHASILADCRWCESLMSGILTAAHLDYWYDRWNASHSDGSSWDDEQHDVKMDEFETDECEVDREIDSSEKENNQPGYGWTLNLPNFKQNSGQLCVQVSFIQWDNVAMYTMIEVALELSWDIPETEDGNLLLDLKGDKAVCLTFEAFAKPGELNWLTGVRCSHC